MKLVITGVGMVTSLGYGAVGSCAAIEADLRRPQAMGDFTVADGEGGSYAVVTHPVAAFAEGFTEVGAWVRLAAGSLQDLLHATELPPAEERGFWDRTGLIALAPLIDEGRLPAVAGDGPESLREAYALALVRLMRRPIQPRHVHVLALGHCGMAVALQKARELLSTHALERMIVVGADSYLDTGSLEWLYRQRRLKVPGKPTGLMPGQAGACVLLESEASARARVAPLGGRVRAISVSPSPPVQRPQRSEMGNQLADVIQETLTRAGVEERFRGGVLLDLNGEEWKAHVWGHAQSRLHTRLDLERCWTCLPCASLGETGAASAPLSLGVAVSRLLGQGGQVLVCSLSDSGQSAGVLLEGA